jgi:hypothetical protein
MPKVDIALSTRRGFVPAPWQNPLPLEEYTMTRIVVYYYSGRWIPIKFCRFNKAIKLYRQAKLQGQEIFIFPADFKPDDS